MHVSHSSSSIGREKIETITLLENKQEDLIWQVISLLLGEDERV